MRLKHYYRHAHNFPAFYDESHFYDCYHHIRYLAEFQVADARIESSAKTCVGIEQLLLLTVFGILRVKRKDAAQVRAEHDKSYVHMVFMCGRFKLNVDGKAMRVKIYIMCLFVLNDKCLKIQVVGFV